MKKNTRWFKNNVYNLYKKDKDVQETAFSNLSLIADSFITELIEICYKETNTGVRAWLVELIAHAKSPDSLDFLSEQFYHPCESIQHWAIRGLQLLNTPQSRKVLYQLQQNQVL
ncbi:MAG: HEAT repeat domain-containing protein [Bacteroidia bacterium]